MVFSIRTFSVLTLAVMLGGGCYTYTPPAASTESDSFTKRNLDSSDEILQKIDTLCLEEAQKIAVLNNPSFIAAYHSVNAAKMRYYQAIGAYSPTIDANFGLNQAYNYPSSQVNQNNGNTNSFTTSTGVTANWLIFDGLIREMNMLAAKHNYKYQQALEDDTRRLLLQAVAQAYNNILQAYEKERIAIADREFQKKNLAETEIKFEAGAVSLSDVLNFQIKVNDADSNLISASYEREIAYYALAVLMGYPEGNLPGEIKFPKITTQVDTLDVGVDVYLDSALQNRPDLQAYREALKVAQYNVYSSYGAFSPKFYANTGFGYNTNLTRYSDSMVNHTYGANPSFNYGASATWNLFSGLQTYNSMREAQALLANSEYQVAAQWLTVVNDVRSAFANYTQNVKQAKLFEKTLGLVIKQRDLVEEEYRAGNTEITRLNEAQLNLVQAETNLVAALVNLKQAKAQLEAATNSNTIGAKTTASVAEEDAKLEPLEDKKDDTVLNTLLPTD